MQPIERIVIRFVGIVVVIAFLLLILFFISLYQQTQGSPRNEHGVLSLNKPEDVARTLAMFLGAGIGASITLLGLFYTFRKSSQQQDRAHFWDRVRQCDDFLTNEHARMDKIELDLWGRHKDHKEQEFSYRDSAKVYALERNVVYMSNMLNTIGVDSSSLGPEDRELASAFQEKHLPNITYHDTFVKRLRKNFRLVPEVKKKN